MDIEAYIRQAAAVRGIDPNVAVRVARSEGGLKDPFRQSDVVKNGRRERSYGPFQLYMDGGLGNRALEAGIDPRQDWQGGIDFALDNAAKDGWGQWYGSKAVGIGPRQGIGGARPIGVSTGGRPLGGIGVGGGGVGPTRGLTLTSPPFGGPTPVNTPPQPGGINVPPPQTEMPGGPMHPILDAFKNQGFMGGMKALGANKGMMGSIGDIAKLFKPPEQKQSAPIQSILPSMEAGDAARIAQAQQLMSMLMAGKQKKLPGLSLMG